jgi:hypothetical protein
VIGHSRGSVAGLKFATTVETPLPFFVNVSGRYKMNDNQIYRNRPEIGEALKKQVKAYKIVFILICLRNMIRDTLIGV